MAVLALSNGLAIESLADPESVPPELFGTVLNLLLAALASGDERAYVAEPRAIYAQNQRPDAQGIK